MGKVVYCIDDGSGRYSLEDCYQFEHFEVDSPMPDFLIHFLQTVRETIIVLTQDNAMRNHVILFFGNMILNLK